MTHSAYASDIGAIRRLLLSAFTAVELRRFCQDRPNLRPILDRCSPNSALDHLIDEVIAFCELQMLFDELLVEVKQVNPRQYGHWRQQESRQLRPDENRAGSQHLQHEGRALREVANRQTPSRVAQTQLSAIPVGVITAISGPAKGQCVVLTRQSKKIIFGRTTGDSDYGVGIPEIAMSRSHFLVQVVPSTEEDERSAQHIVELLDLNSSNGTYVNGERVVPVAPIPLNHGDLIRVGSSEFQLSLLQD